MKITRLTMIVLALVMLLSLFPLVAAALTPWKATSPEPASAL